MGLAAEAALANRKPGESALDILDRICSRYRGLDAEFESTNPDNPDQVHPRYDNVTDPHPEAALGMLMVEAFSPGGLEDMPRYRMMFDSEFDADDAEAAFEEWNEKVYKPFNDRYSFC